MDSSAALAPLGITTGIAVQIDEEVRLERYRLQSLARLGLPHERVAGCLRSVLNGESGPLVWREVERNRAKYGGLMVCGSIWVCAVCAAAIGEARRQDLAAMVAKGRAAGYQVSLATLTFSHGSTDELRESVGRLLAAYRAMQEHRDYRGLKRDSGYVGAVKALEVTWGESNGWHPHLHVLVFDGGYLGDLSEYEFRLRDCWDAALVGQGLNGSADRMVKVEVAGDEVERYIAKFGHEPAHRQWGVGDEMAKWHTKRAGRSINGVQRYTPFDLLRWYADTAKDRPLDLFREYAAVFKGRHQLQVSRGLRDTLGADLPMSDEEAAAWIDPDAELLARLTVEEWLLVKYFDVRGVLLEVAGKEGAKGLRSFLDGLLQI